MKGAVVFTICFGLASTAAADSWERYDYTLHCSGCHRPTGAGSALVPSLEGMEEMLDVKGGRSYLVQVPGVAQAPLSDARLANLLNWLIARFVKDHAGPPYRAAEVRSLRQRPLRDPLKVRSHLRTASKREYGQQP